MVHKVLLVTVNTGTRSKFCFYGSLNMMNVKLMAQSMAIYIWLNDGGYMSLYNATYSTLTSFAISSFFR